MMERNYPNSGFTEPVTAAAQSAGWAYKPSSSYGSAQLDSDLLQRQAFVSNHHPSTFTTTHHPTGVFDSNQQSTASSNTTESSVMNFLSAIESRGLQAGPAGSTLLPPFRSTSWQTGANSSAELFLTGALHPSGTFSTPSSLSSYQHSSAFQTHSFTTTSALAVTDSTFSSSNGLLSPNDLLLQVKSSQSTVPTAVAFDRLGGAALGAGLPPQSSTYRSAQESAPHLLQPQFSLLHTALGSSHQAPQPYSAPIFSSSIERVLQRECSVIKHLQRPSSTQPVQEEIVGSTQHSLQGYVHNNSDASYQQDPSPHTPVPCSPVGDPSHTVNGSSQQKTTLQLTQAYASSVPSPGFSSSSGINIKKGSSKVDQHPSENTDTQTSSPGQQQSFSSQAQKQSLVIASQSQPYTSAQLSGLVSISAPHSYISSPSLTSNLSQTQTFSSSLPEKLPSIFKTLSSFTSQSEAQTPVNQSLIYSSSQAQDLPPAGNSEGYDSQMQTLGMVSPSQSYSSSHSQILPTISFYTQGPTSASIPLQNYASSQSLTQSTNFSPSCGQNLSSTNPTPGYVLMQPSVNNNTDSAPLQQKYLLCAQSSTSCSASQTQALPNDQSSVDIKPYEKGKQDKQMFLSSKESTGELSIEDVQALQKGSMEISSQSLSGNATEAQSSTKDVVHVLSKMEDRQNTQSVIRCNSRSEEQIVGLNHLKVTKDERMISSSQDAQLVTSANTSSDSKSNSLLMHSTHAPLSADQLKQHTLLLKGTSSQQQNHQGQIIRVQQGDPRQLSEDHTQFIQVPSAQVLLEPSHMIVFQQSVLASGQTQPKQAMYMQSVPVQYLQMNSDTINLTTHGHPSQQVVPPQISNSAESSKQKLSQTDNFSQSNPHDTKQNFSLSSVCFPESVLLADERNILSNVDDILAATVAACGVTPQDFVKSASSDGSMSSAGNPADSKCHLQSVENRLDSFPSQQMIIGKSQTMTVNGAQMSFPKEEVGGHQVFTFSSSQIQQDVTNRSAQEISDKIEHSLEQNDVLTNGHFVDSSNGSALHANGLVVSGTTSSDFHLAQEYSASEHGNSKSLLNNINQPKVTKGVKTDDGLTEHSADGLPKKRSRSKGSSKSVENENGQPKSQKRTTQAKRQNSHANEASSNITSEVCHDNYQQQERMQQKLREVEEKQPEVKTGFLGSFLDFLKSGPRQLSSPPIRTPNRTRKPSTSRRTTNLLLSPFKPTPPSTPLTSIDHGVISTKRLDEDLQRNLETLPSFSSDEDDSVGKNQDLQMSITSALSSLDEPSDRKQKLGDNTKHTQASSTQPTNVKPQDQQKAVQMSAEELLKDVPPDQLAVQLITVAIEGLMDDGLSDSGGEGMYRERDEFVVKNEDIERLRITLTAGVEPPAIWKVQKALLQKFVPELRDGKRVFFATNSYLGYFGDAKSLYRRVHVKFLDTVNKREYVRVCSRKPRCKPMHSMRGSQAKALLAQRFTAATVSASPTQKTAQQKNSLPKPRPRQPKTKAEPPPKKRKKWKEEFTTSPCSSSPEAVSVDNELTPLVPFTSRFLNTRTMKETFKSFVELLISVALDSDVMNALERENDELLLPHMRRVDGMITDNRRRLLPKLHMGQIFKNALDSFPELSAVTELNSDSDTPIFKVRLSGKTYNRKTMKPSKSPSKLPLEYTVDQQKTKWFSLYHSLQHYKYHTYLLCMEEIELLKSRGKDLGQEETVQTCMGNRAWVEGLFDRFGELLTQVQQACL